MGVNMKPFGGLLLVLMVGILVTLPAPGCQGLKCYHCNMSVGCRDKAEVIQECPNITDETDQAVEYVCLEIRTQFYVLFSRRGCATTKEAMCYANAEMSIFWDKAVHNEKTHLNQLTKEDYMKCKEQFETPYPTPDKDKKCAASRQQTVPELTSGSNKESGQARGDGDGEATKPPEEPTLAPVPKRYLNDTRFDIFECNTDLCNNNTQPQSGVNY